MILILLEAAVCGEKGNIAEEVGSETTVITSGSLLSLRQIFQLFFLFIPARDHRNGTGRERSGGTVEGLPLSTAAMAMGGWDGVIHVLVVSSSSSLSSAVSQGRC